MKTITVTVLGETFFCKSFFDIAGIEVYRDNERLGSIIGESIPDEADSDAVGYFENILIEWLIDNGF